jgi:murein DD-endopeptidase MepM/ murein hydrolase activator NlpD
LSKELAIQSKSLDVILKLAEAKNDFLSAIPAIQPVRNENLKQMASGFGYRILLPKQEKCMKEWILRPNGHSIYATGDGVVAKADNTASGYGNHIVIRHGFGYETLYAFE